MWRDTSIHCVTKRIHTWRAVTHNYKAWRHSFIHNGMQLMQTQCDVPHPCTGWRRLIGSPKLQIIFHKRGTKYRSLLRKMTYKDKGSYGSSPPCTTGRIHMWRDACRHSVTWLIHQFFSSQTATGISVAFPWDSIKCIPWDGFNRIHVWWHWSHWDIKSTYSFRIETSNLTHTHTQTRTRTHTQAHKHVHAHAHALETWSLTTGWQRPTVCHIFWLFFRKRAL